MKVERSSLGQSVSTWVVLVRIHHRNNLLPRLPLGPLNFDSRFHPHHIGTPLPFILNSRTMRRPTGRCLNAVPCRDRFTADAVQQPTILFSLHRWVPTLSSGVLAPAVIRHQSAQLALGLGCLARHCLSKRRQTLLEFSANCVCLFRSPNRDINACGETWQIKKCLAHAAM
jgi:hypothetical protein